MSMVMMRSGVVVLAQVVRDDVAVGHVRAQLESDGHRRARGAPCLFAAERERSGIVQAAREDVGDGLCENLDAVELEELAGARRS